VASSREFVVPTVLGLALACSTGHGEGELHGEVHVPGCTATTSYELRPTAFFAQTTENLLRIRVQRGSDLEVRSDGIAVLVEDANKVKRDYLNQDLAVAPGNDPRVDVSVFLNESCPPGRSETPFVLSAVSGTIVFDHIYAPEVSKDDVEIRAELTNVRFEDPRNSARYALLSGYFDFLYTRGSPAQRFP
jgi:hypothetical protein